MEVEHLQFREASDLGRDRRNSRHHYHRQRPLVFGTTEHTQVREVGHIIRNLLHKLKRNVQFPEVGELHQKRRERLDDRGLFLFLVLVYVHVARVTRHVVNVLRVVDVATQIQTRQSILRIRLYHDFITLMIALRRLRLLTAAQFPMAWTPVEFCNSLRPSRVHAHPIFFPNPREKETVAEKRRQIGIKKRPAGIEPATSQSAIECSTTELKSLSCLLSFTGALESPISFSHPRHLRTERGEWVTTNTLFIWAGPNSFRES